jgi:hypothetical protein
VSPDLEAIHDERLASYGDDDGDESPPYAVGDRVGRDGRVVLAVDHDAVLLSEVGGDPDGASWIDGYALARRS